jgi:hypothetical protein
MFSSNALSGVIAHLTGKCGGNVHDQDFAAITASSVFSFRDTPWNAADLEDKNLWFWSKDEPGQ